MTRAIPLILVWVLLLAGCGTTGSSDDPTAASTPTPAIGTDERSIDAVEEQLQDLARRKDAAKKAGDTETVDELEQSMQKIERAQDEAVEEEFASGTPFDKAVDRLPLDKPPLFVEQFVLDDSHELVVRTRPERFFCGKTEQERLATVQAYYDLAQKAMSAEGVDDFVLIVDGLRETGVVKPLARGKGGRVSLTARGRGAGPC